MENLKKKCKDLWAKLKTVKHIELVLAVGAICILVVVYISVTQFTDKTSAVTQSAPSLQTAATGGDITTEVESKLEAILSKIEGAGEVKVMITFKSTPEIKTANTVNEHTAGGATVTTLQPVFTNGSVVILAEEMPEIEGVIVVAKGGGDMKTKLRIIQACQAVLDLKGKTIEVFPMG
ncbi:MAG: hypothetical protein LBN25_03760 [Christensenellaceae bacterium]|jgi:stage III sporulation protein AG|nr:hypothetical protein [Christensenellaceae bacterium]